MSLSILTLPRTGYPESIWLRQLNPTPVEFWPVETRHKAHEVMSLDPSDATIAVTNG